MSERSRLESSVSSFGALLDALPPLRLLVCAVLLVGIALTTLTALDAVLGAGRRRIAPVEWLADNTGLWSKHPPRRELTGRRSRGIGVSPGLATQLYGGIGLSLAMCLGGVLIWSARWRWHAVGGHIAVWSLALALFMVVLTVIASMGP